MIYYYFCLVLIFLFIFLFLNEIIRDIKKHPAAIYIVPFCFLLAILFKYNFGIHFWGLEYEDSYAFSFCARQFSYGIYSSSFLIDAISAGSLDNPIYMSTYGGHFITYPTFLSIFTQLFGWSPKLLCIINTITALGNLLVLSLISNDKKFWFVAPIIYCVAPIINVFTTCFLSEIFSSFICLTFVYSYLKKDRQNHSLLCFISFGLALLCKRENLALVFIPLVISIISNRNIIDKKSLIDIIKHNAPYFVIICVYLFGIQNVFNIESIESNDIGQSTFSFDNFTRLFPLFIKSLLSIKAFSVTFYIYIVCVIYILVRKERLEKIHWISIIMMSIYLLLYSCHYRGYFFAKYRQVNVFETYRYINNFYYFIPLIFSSFSIKKINIIYIPMALLLIISYFRTMNLRGYLSDIEQESRFEEVHIVRDYIKRTDKSSVLISENILLYQNICESDFVICDISLVDKLNLDDTINEYYCLFPDIEYFKERYGVNIDKGKFRSVLPLPHGDSLYQYITD